MALSDAQAIILGGGRPCYAGFFVFVSLIIGTFAEGSLNCRLVRRLLIDARGDVAAENPIGKGLTDEYD
jgi:hypothetical protein